MTDSTPACTCLPYWAGGDGPEIDCPVHGDDPKVDEVARDVLLRFTPEQHREIEEFAATFGVTKYALIRHLVKEGDPR